MRESAKHSQTGEDPSAPHSSLCGHASRASRQPVIARALEGLLSVLLLVPVRPDFVLICILQLRQERPVLQTDVSQVRALGIHLETLRRSFRPLTVSPNIEAPHGDFSLN